MQPKLYALLVGINDYATSPLRGCVNDCDAMREMLTGRAAPEALELAQLTNGEATREAIIQVFRSHFGRASAGDTALFYFSGHGSQEPVPPLYRDLEPDSLCETLVAFDSRLPGGRDLADKELAVLLAEVAARGPHVVVVLDCCHSGTATRDTDGLTIRRHIRDVRPRSFESYWFVGDRSVPSDLDAAGGWKVLPRGRHVLLAACEADQVSLEISDRAGERRGLFTRSLLAALSRFDHLPSYRELLKQTELLVARGHDRQRPCLEGDARLEFLRGTLRPAPRLFHARREPDRVWRLDGGFLHGIEPGCRLSLFKVSETDFRDHANRVAMARVTSAGPANANLEIELGELTDLEVAAPAVVSEHAVPALRVAIEAGPRVEARLREVLTADASLLNVPEASAGELILRSEGDRLHLLGAAGRSLLADSLPLEWLDHPASLLEELGRIARWRSLRSLEAGPSALGAVNWEVVRWQGPPREPRGEPETDSFGEVSEADLWYQSQEGPCPAPPRVTMRVSNRSERKIYASILSLSDACAIEPLDEEAYILPPGGSFWLRPQEGVPFLVPENLFLRGVTHRRDHLVLLACDGPTDFDLIRQGPLFAGIETAPRFATNRGLSVLEQLFARLTRREHGIERGWPAASNWTARHFELAVFRPAAWVVWEGPQLPALLPGGGTLTSLTPAKGRVRPHSELVTRHLAPEVLRAADRLAPGFAPMPFAGRLASDPGLSALEVQIDATGQNTTTIALEVPATLGPGEHPLALLKIGAIEQVLPATEGGASRARFELPLPSELTQPETRVWVQLLVGKG